MIYLSVFLHNYVGWPNAPSTPELSGKGRILYVNWTKPVYLGGLNNSLIHYEVYRYNFKVRLIKYANCSSSDTQCNVTMETEYNDLLSINGLIETFYVSLNMSEATSTMCQGYTTPHAIQSERSRIDVKELVGELLINKMTCTIRLNRIHVY